jgi:hypothetical protein
MDHRGRRREVQEERGLIVSAVARFVGTFSFAADYGVPASVLGELAALEQAQLEVQDELDERATVRPQRLAELTPAEWESASFRLARALRVVHASHDVLPVVQAVAGGERPERPVPGPVAYLVCRAGGEVVTERLRSATATVLEALAAGTTFGDACGAGARIGDAEDETIAVDAVRLLVLACARGLVLQVRVDSGGAPA